MKNIRKILEKFCPEMDDGEIRSFLYIFFPFMFGIYPYTAVTEKQRESMKEADVDFVYQSIYDVTLSCLVRLLGAE